MKKIKLLFMMLFSIMILPIMVNAASGKITISGTSTTVVGNKVTVTVKLSSGASWEMNLNYDKNYLQLISGGGEAGGTKMVNTSAGKPNRTYTFTFKTLKKGSTTVKIGSYYIVDDDFNTMDISAGSKTIKIITQEELEASYSKDNNLKSLSVEGYEFDKEFNKDKVDYVVNVPEGTTSINILATANDSKSSISGKGTVEVSPGTNNLKIVVRAENGSEKTYNLVVNVIDQNPINVEIDNEKYTVIKLRNNFTCPELYTESEVTINNMVIPACTNEFINYTLVGLKKEDGTVISFRYFEGKYLKYNEIVGQSIKLVNDDFTTEIDGLIKEKVEIDGIEYDAYKFSNISKFYVIYGIDIATGEKGLYVYDSLHKTISGYDTEYIDYLKEQNELYLYIIITFGVGLFLAIICILLLSKGKKKRKKVKEKNNNKNDDVIKNKEEIKDDNFIKEKKDNKEIEEDKTDTYYLFENDKKKKHKK